MRRQLALVALATTSMVALALLVPLARALSTIPRDRATSEAQLTAQSIVQAIGAIRDPVRLGRFVDQTTALAKGAVSVMLPDGRTLGRAFPDSPAVERAKQGSASVSQIAGGLEVLTPTVLASGTAVVRVAVAEEDLRRGVRGAWTILACLGLVMVLLAVAVADRLARSIVKPISALASTTRALERGDLAARVHPAGPAEVREVGHTLNRLAVRIGELLTTEREAIADLSHRLRTPITALRLDAEGLADPVESARITADIDALTRSVDQLIRTARQPTSNAPSSCELVAVVRERSDFWHALAEEQGRVMTRRIPERTSWVGVSAEQLGAAIDVLIENVFAHTDDATSFAVIVETTRDHVLVHVVDDGPGMPADALARGSSGSGSTGLGMSIARDTMEAVGGTFELVPRAQGGTRATMRFVPLGVGVR